MSLARRRSIRFSLVSLLLLATALGIFVANQAPASTKTTYTHGMDISWPQCHGSQAANMPGGSPTYLILGLTDGSGDTANQCLASQVAWAKERGIPVGAYLVPSFPTSSEIGAGEDGVYGHCSSYTCQLHNAGAEMSASAINVMRANGMHAPMIWLDVEFRHYEPWQHHDANDAVLQGVVRGMQSQGMPFGVYTTSYMWDSIAGSYRLNVPNWLPTGDGNPQHAQEMCGETATGGPTWITQYTRTLDNDLTCPIMDAVPGKHSKLWKYRNTTVKLFDSGNAVTAAQRRLDTDVSGSYDLKTSFAAREYENEQSLPVNGQVSTPEWRSWGAYKIRGGHPFWLPKVVTLAD